MNVLITSVSHKIPLIKAVRYALDKKGEGGIIWGGDINKACIGRFFVDQFWEMPFLEALSIDDLIAFCSSHHISVIIPTRDGELPFFAAHKEALATRGIFTMVSSLNSLDTAQDKWLFFQKLEALGYRSISTAKSPDVLDGNSFVVKEQLGAGSKTIGLNLNKEKALAHAQKLNQPIYQVYISGKEISVDLYIDLSGKCKGGVARWREWIVNGESQTTTTFRDEDLEAKCCRLAEELQLYGHIMFQLIRNDESNEDLFLECNPRFGGASTLSLAMGLDSFYWFFIEASGSSLNYHPFRRGMKQKRLVRYPEDLICVL